MAERLHIVAATEVAVVKNGHEQWFTITTRELTKGVVMVKDVTEACGGDF